MADEPLVLRPRPRDISKADNSRLTASLNDDQARAATFGDGPLLVIAGAGTGKTRTLIHRVAALIERGIAPERILLLTFTRRAAGEMLGRAEQLVGSAGARVHGGTFHSVGHRLLRQFGSATGLPADFTIMDQGDAVDLMQLSRGALGVAKGQKRFPKKETLHYLYSRHINTEPPSTNCCIASMPSSSNTSGRSRAFSPTMRLGNRTAISSTTTTCCCSGR